MEPDHIHPWRTGCTEEFASPRVGCLFQRHISQLLLSHTGNRSGKTCKFHDPLRVTNKFDKIESTSKHIFSYQSSSFHKNFLNIFRKINLQDDEALQDEEMHAPHPNSYNLSHLHEQRQRCRIQH